jgi:hypothetical protein
VDTHKEIEDLVIPENQCILEKLVQVTPILEHAVLPEEQLPADYYRGLLHRAPLKLL